MANDSDTVAELQVVSIDLRRYFRVIRKHKWLVAAVVALVVTGTLIWTSRQTKIYSGTASILIDPRPPDFLGGGVQEIVQLGAGNFFSNTDYYNSQVEIVKSLALAKATVEAKDLHLKLLRVKDDDL